MLLLILQLSQQCAGMASSHLRHASWFSHVSNKLHEKEESNKSDTTIAEKGVILRDRVRGDDIPGHIQRPTTESENESSSPKPYQKRKKIANYVPTQFKTMEKCGEVYKNIHSNIQKMKDMNPETDNEKTLHTMLMTVSQAMAEQERVNKASFALHDCASEDIEIL